MGSDDSALQAVVAADVELMQLRQEEAEILERQESSEPGTAEADDDSDRLNEIYERMQVLSILRACLTIHALEMPPSQVPAGHR